MRKPDEHVLIPTLKRQLVDRLIDRREFVRYAALLGMSAPAAYAFVRKVTGEPLLAPAAAQGLPRVRRAAPRHAVPRSPGSRPSDDDGRRQRHAAEPRREVGGEPGPQDVDAAAASRGEVAQRPGVHSRRRRLEPQARPRSEDRLLGPRSHEGFPPRGVRDGREKDDKGNAKKSTRLWDANAIQKIDTYTVRLNGKTAQLAVPEQLFHYPLLILDPAENGEFKVGSAGTGAFSLVESEVGRRQILRARKEPYWGGGPYLDEIQFIDLGDDPAAAVNALASRQVDGLYGADITQLDALQKLPHVQMYQVITAYTATARVHPIKPFDDKRVRQALRYAIDANSILQLAHKGLGQPGEHHHVSPVHPEYAKLPMVQRDVARAKRLLAEAGYPNGIDTEIACKPQPGWELLAVQAMVEQWKEAGIRVKINVMPSTQYWEIWTKTPFGFTTWAHRPLGVMSLALAYRTGVPWNESKYSNAEFDRLLGMAEGTIDVAARREMMAQLEKILQEDGPIVQPVWRAIFTFMDKRVQGFKVHPTLYIFGHQLAIST